MVLSSATQFEGLKTVQSRQNNIESFQVASKMPGYLSKLSGDSTDNDKFQLEADYNDNQLYRGDDNLSTVSTNISSESCLRSTEDSSSNYPAETNGARAEQSFEKRNQAKFPSPIQSPISSKVPFPEKQQNLDPREASCDTLVLPKEDSNRTRAHRPTVQSTASHRAAAVAAAGLQDEVLVGTRVSEGHENFVTAYNMLTGIRVAVSRCTAKNNRKLTDNDFMATDEISFDLSGGGHSPSSKYIFQFKDYFPWVFRHLRDLFRLDPADYLMSLTAKYIVSELGSPGKSGSFFYYSRDYRFIIKTIRHSEHKLLRNIIRQYHQHVKQNPNTLISQFYGLHRVKLPFGRKIYFVVMNNVFPALYEIHERFDLKGSILGREYKPDLSKPIVVYKDLDWLRRHKRIVLGPEKREAMVRQLEVDTRFLQSVNAMDYSLLIGIHDMSLGNAALKSLLRLEEFGPQNGKIREHEEKAASAALKGFHGPYLGKNKTVQQEFAELQMLLQRANPEKLKEFDFADEYRSKFYFYKDHGGFQSTNDQNEETDVIYYVGVIDFLTGYTFRKRVETFFKSLVYDRKELSAVPAKEYGDRFLRFLRGSIGPAIPSTMPQKRQTEEFKDSSRPERIFEQRNDQAASRDRSVAIEKAARIGQTMDVSPVSVKTKSESNSVDVPLAAHSASVNGQKSNLSTIVGEDTSVLYDSGEETLKLQPSNPVSKQNHKVYDKKIAADDSGESDINTGEKLVMPDQFNRKPNMSNYRNNERLLEA